MGKKKARGRAPERVEVRYVEVRPPERPGLGSTLSRLLPDSTSERFLIGALAGGALAYALGDRGARDMLMRATLRGYGRVAAGLAEFKEQAADIRAELRADQHEAP